MRLGPRHRRVRNVALAEQLAKRRLPRSVYDFVRGGTEGELTAHDNLAAFAEVEFRPHAAVETRDRVQSVTVVGCELSTPVIVAPTGMIRIVHPDGEVGAARAAGRAGTAIGISTLSSYPIEDIAAATDGPVFYQVYFAGGRTGAELAIDRARDAGCRAVIVTVDTAAAAGREETLRGGGIPRQVDLRTALQYAPEMVTKPAWVLDFLRGGLDLATPNVQTQRGGPPLSAAESSATMRKATPTWDDCAWIKERFGGPLIVKGILSVEDARRALDHGADAIVVSNHGGNALDSSPAALRVLPSVVDAVGDRTEVLFDSGIRRGGDVVKAMALGARAVLVGRAYVWGLAAAGEEGVYDVLQSLRRGIDGTLALLGCPSVHDLDHSYVHVPSWPSYQ